MAVNEAERSQSRTSDRALVTQRLISAPRVRVFAAWIDPGQAEKWWGPNGFRTTTLEADVRPGGIWRHIMHGPDGRDYPNRIRYVEIRPPECIVYDHDDDSDHGVTRFHATVTFEEANGKTLLTLRSEFATAEELDRVAKEHGAIEGAVQHLERLADYLGDHR